MINIIDKRKALTKLQDIKREWGLPVYHPPPLTTTHHPYINISMLPQSPIISCISSRKLSRCRSNSISQWGALLAWLNPDAYNEVQFLSLTAHDITLRWGWRYSLLHTERAEHNPSKLNVYYITGNGFIVVHDLQYTYLYIEDIRYTHKLINDHICHSRVLTDCLYSVCISRDISQISSQPRVFWLITLRLKSRHHMRAWKKQVLIIVIVIVLTRSLAHNLVESKWQLLGEKQHLITSNKKESVQTQNWACCSIAPIKASSWNTHSCCSL